MSDFLQKSYEASRAAQTIESLRKDLLNTKSQEDCLRIIRSAEELKGYYTLTYASSFDGVVAEAHKRMVEIGAESKQRNLKDPRPRPDKKTRSEYTSKAWELLPAVESDREVARQVITWARKQGNKDPTGFGRWRILGESALQKIAGKLRNDWAKERAKRKKRQIRPFAP